MCFSAIRKLLVLFLLAITLVALSMATTFANEIDVELHGYPGAHAPLYHSGTHADEAIFTITNFTPYTVSSLKEYAPAVDVYTNLGPSYKNDIASNASAMARINYKHTVEGKCEWDPQFSINDPAGAVLFKLVTMPSKARSKPGSTQLPTVATIFTNIQKVTTDHSNSKGGLGKGVWNIATSLTSNSYYMDVVRGVASVAKLGIRYAEKDNIVSVVPMAISDQITNSEFKYMATNKGDDHYVVMTANPGYVIQVVSFSPQGDATHGNIAVNIYTTDQWNSVQPSN